MNDFISLQIYLLGGYLTLHLTKKKKRRIQRGILISIAEDRTVRHDLCLLMTRPFSLSFRQKITVSAQMKSEKEKFITIYCRNSNKKEIYAVMYPKPYPKKRKCVRKAQLENHISSINVITLLRRPVIEKLKVQIACHDHTSREQSGGSQNNGALGELDDSRGSVCLQVRNVVAGKEIVLDPDELYGGSTKSAIHSVVLLYI